MMIKFFLNFQCELMIDGCWHALTKVLATKPELKLKSALRILESAGMRDQWEVVKLILETNHDFTKKDFEHFITAATHQQRWDVIREVFKREFLGRKELLCQILPITVRMRWWERTEEILHMVSGQLKLNILLAEAALTGKEMDLQDFCNKKDRDSDVLSAILLVAAAGGTSDGVAETLLSLTNTYPKDVFPAAIQMSLWGGSYGMIPLLLSHEDAHYSFQDLCNISKSSWRRRNVEIVTEFLNNYRKEYQDSKTGGLKVTNS